MQMNKGFQKSFCALTAMHSLKIQWVAEHIFIVGNIVNNSKRFMI